MERERNGSAAFDVAKDGIRKAALLLSVLDAEAADALLARFEPEVARAIEAEAEAVGNVPAEDVDAIVAEFLTLSETAETPQTLQTPQTPQTPKTPKTAETREATNGTASEFDDALFDGRGRVVASFGAAASGGRFVVAGREAGGGVRGAAGARSNDGRGAALGRRAF